MVKLALLVVFLGLAYGESSIAEGHKQIDKGNNSAETTQADKRGTESSPLVVDAHTIHSDEEAAEESRRDAEQNRANGWIIALTFVIAICAGLQFLGIVGQIFVYLKQANLMDKTLAETKKSADAAFLNAQAVVTGQRPWLLIKPIDPPQGHGAIQDLKFTFTNHGKSPALVLHTYFDFCYLPKLEKLTEIHDPWTSELRLTHAEWLEPCGQRDIEGSVPVNVIQPVLDSYDPELRIGTKRVWIWGGVRYQSPLKDEIYESKFCYMWTHNGQFVMGGPQGANECT